MRCDLHVHTYHSGMCSIPMLRSICRECYTDPQHLYETLKRKGMDLVTVTDHDSIDAVESLRTYPDFFVSEEITCRMPSGTELHVGVYNITDRHHLELQRRSADLPSLLAYLREQKLFYSANHIFSSLTGRRDIADFDWFESRFPAVEIQNGCMLKVTNRNAAAFAAGFQKTGLGGSDAHTIQSAGSAWTEVAGARTKQEFLAGLSAGTARVGGEDGSYWKLTRDILSIGVTMVAENPWRAPLTLLAGLAPLVTLGNYIRELGFSALWSRRLTGRGSAPEVTEEVAAA